MRDQEINSFSGGMLKDLGSTIPQNSSYVDAQNIRIITDGSSENNSGVVVDVKGNTYAIDLQYQLPTGIYAGEEPSGGGEPNQPGGTDAGEGTTVVGGNRITERTTTVNVKIIGHCIIRNSIITFGIAYGIGDLEGINYSVIHKLDINYSTEGEGVLGPVQVIYASDELNFNEAYPIQTVGRYETENIQRVYWTDNLNPVRTINILQENVSELPVEELNLIIPVNFSSPEITRVDSSGTLPAGMYQYSYRLKTTEGAVTRFSPLSNFTHVVAGSKYWDYQEDPENQTEYGNTTPGEETDKAVTLNINQIDLDYDFIEVAAIYKTGDGAIQNCYIIKEIRLSSSNVSVTHRTADGAPVLLEEITEITNIPDKVKTLATKDNRLFFGGVQYSPFNLEFNARAYRYKRPDNIKYAAKSINDTSTPGTMSTYVDPNFDPITQAGSSNYTIQHNLDAVNPYNNILKTEVPSYQQYKYKKDGITLGGEGLNVEYEFYKERLDGNQGTQNWDIPDEPPFVSGILVQEGGGDKGDYKSPYNVSKFLGYHRDEVYRFGVVLYDLNGNPGFVNWIGDIRFPSYQDYDHKHTGGTYNWTIAQVSTTGSGTNYNISSSANAYENMEFYDPLNILGDYEEVTSSYNFEDEDFNEYVGGNMYALGIMFKVNIPDDIKDKISGYRIVRLERKEVDKTILGSGILNYGAILSKSISGGIAEYQGYNTNLGAENPDAGLPLAYGTSTGGSSYSQIVTIDSPDFAFSKVYPTSSENYLQVIGAVTGKIKHDFEGNSVGSATGYCSHTLALEEAHLFSTHSLSYSTKLDVGTNLNIPGTDFLENTIENQGFFNKCFNNGTDRIVGIGEETLLIKLTDINTAEPFSGANNDYEEISGGVFSQYWIEEGLIQDDLAPYIGGVTFQQASSTTGTLGKAKLLASIRAERPDQYGGNTQLARQSNVYIPAGPFINIDGDLLNTKIDEFGRHKVWGGDTYVVIYDLEKIRRHDSNIDSGEGATGGRNQSLNYAFPVESSFNTTLRGGWHFANKKDWATDSETLLNTFDLDSCYSSENTTEVFIPKPDNFSESVDYGARVLYSDAKINAEQKDSWRKFRLESYRDVDGLYGNINKLIVNNDIMYYLQNNAFGRLAINPVSTVLDQDGSAIVLGTGSVIQDHAYISTTIGCESPFHALESNKGIYWIDRRTKKIYAFRANGLESISDVHSLKSWCSSNIFYDSNIVIGNDMVNDEILFSLDNETLVFSEILNKFTSFYSYTTSMYINARSKLFSLSESKNEIFEHNIGDPMTFYGIVSPSSIEFIVNKNPIYTKVFDNIEWYTESDDNKFQMGVFSNSIDTKEDNLSEVVVKERINRMPVPRTNAQARFRDTYLKVKLQSMQAFVLHYVKTLFRISRR